MWLSCLLLILPLTSGASIKLTKRRLADSKPLSRPFAQTRIPRGQIESDPLTSYTAKRCGGGRRARRNLPEAISLSKTIYTTVQTTIFGSTPSVTAIAGQPQPFASDASLSYTTVQVYVTVSAGSAPPQVQAIESGTISLSTVTTSVITASGPSATASLVMTGFVTSATGIAATTQAVSSQTTAVQTRKLLSTDATSQPTTSASPSVGSAAFKGGKTPIPGKLVISAADPWVYTIDMKIGPEAKVVPMLVDTGSYSFWAADASCSNCITNGMVGALVSNPAQCVKYDAAYGTGHFSGCIVETTVEFEPYKLGNMSMAAAVTVADELAIHGASFSGMFGLAMSGRAGTTTPMSRLLNDGLVTDPWVGLRLQREGEGDSELIFGEALASAHGDPAFHVDLPQRPDGGSQYNITLDSLSILGAEISDPHINGRGVILDSGTSNIVVPEARYVAILSRLSEGGTTKAHPTDGSAMLRCEALPGIGEALSFSFGGVNFPVPWKDIVGPVIDLKGTVYDYVGAPAYCVPRIQTIGTDNWILGDAFLVYHAINTKTGGVQIWRLKRSTST